MGQEYFDTYILVMIGVLGFFSLISSLPRCSPQRSLPLPLWSLGHLAGRVLTLKIRNTSTEREKKKKDKNMRKFFTGATFLSLNIWSANSFHGNSFSYLARLLSWSSLSGENVTKLMLRDSWTRCRYSWKSWLMTRHIFIWRRSKEETPFYNTGN